MTSTLLLQSAYRLLLHLYPSDFRREVGPAMLQDLRDGLSLILRTRGVGGALRYGLRQLIDLVRNAGHEWRTPSGPRVPAGRQGPAAWFRSVGQDLLFASRSLRRDPRFALTVVVVVGLGIAAVVSVYAMLEVALIEPLPYPAGDRIVSMSETFRVTQTKSVAYPNYLDWRDRNRVFEDVAARNWSAFNLTGEGPAQSIWGHGASENLFSLFGIAPVRGRMFTAAELAEQSRVVVIAEGFWRDRLGGIEPVVGRELRLDGETWTIVGVVPEPEEFPFAGAELWVPLTVTVGPNSIVDRTNHPGIEAFGLIREGLGLEQARADLDRVATELAAEFPEANGEAGVLMGPLKSRVIGDADTTLWILFAAVGVVLLGVCANVASLMLARATRRGGEIAVRAALGAGRGRLVRQLLAEGTLLSILAGVLGLVGARVVLGILRGNSSLDLPRLTALDLDGSVAAVALLASAGAGLVFAAAPAVRMLRVEPATALRGADSTRGVTGSGRAGRSALVVVQVALAVALLAGAGLMMRSLTNLAQADLGLDPGHVVAAYLGPPESQYPDNRARVLLYQELAERLRALPGVRRVSGGDPLPMSGRNNQWTVSDDGFPQLDDGLRVDVARVMPDYFSIMGIELLEGRDFRDDDTPEAPAVIVDRTLADFLWPGGDALGKRLRFSGPVEERPWHTVVGVVEHVKNYGARAESRYELYLPYTQVVWGMSLIVEAEPTMPAASVFDGMRTELTRLDPELPLTRHSTIREFIESTTTDEALVARTLAGFAAAALLVAVIGLYGVVSYSVALRSREFGIRMALGAQRGAVLGDVFAEGLRLAGLGVVLGLVVTLLGGRLISSLLFGIPTHDPSTLLGVGAVMAVVATLASLIPARQALRVDPVDALRDGSA